MHCIIFIYMKLRFFYFVLLALVIGWCFALVFPPLSVHVWGKPSILSFAIEMGFSGICHQMPERSFCLWGHPLAVCARCMGIYAGFLFAVLLFPFIYSRLTTKMVLVGSFFPSFFEFSITHGMGWNSSNLLRCLVGIPLGIGLGWLFLSAVFDTQIHCPKRRKVYAKSK